PSLYGVYSPYLNSVAGTSLEPEGVRRTVDNLHPFVSFEGQTKYFVDKSSPEYYGNSMGALIKSLEEAGSISAGIKPDDIVWAASMYHELVEYKEKTEALFKEAEGKELSDEKKTLLDKAHDF